MCSWLARVKGGLETGKKGGRGTMSVARARRPESPLVLRGSFICRNGGCLVYRTELEEVRIGEIDADPLLDGIAAESEDKCWTA